MEFWLMFNNKAEQLHLPVPPQSFELSKGNNNQTVYLNNIGEINLIGKGNLATITISSFFPARNYSFCQYPDFPSPYDCVELIEKWRESGKPIRLIITKTRINLAASIDSFSYGEKDGTRDIHFTLTLKEYRFLNTNQSQNPIARPQEMTPANTTKKYTVKAGDTLYLIAKKFYGDGALWKQLASKNGIRDPQKLPIGKTLVL